MRRRRDGPYAIITDVSDHEEDFDELENYEIDPAILKIYEDLDSGPAPKSPKLRKIRGDGLSSIQTLALLFVFLCAFAWVANIMTYRQVLKLKAEKGHFNTLIHPDVWWNGILVYYIYPKSFQDSDGDGVGDLKGSN